MRCCSSRRHVHNFTRRPVARVFLFLLLNPTHPPVTLVTIPSYHRHTELGSWTSDTRISLSFIFTEPLYGPLSLVSCVLFMFSVIGARLNNSNFNLRVTSRIPPPTFPHPDDPYLIFHRVSCTRINTQLRLLACYHAICKCVAAECVVLEGHLEGHSGSCGLERPHRTIAEDSLRSIFMG